MDLNTLFGYEGKTVVVSGAYSGMGRAAAKLLSESAGGTDGTVSWTSQWQASSMRTSV